jgi:hypothetical protein
MFATNYANFHESILINNCNILYRLEELKNISADFITQNNLRNLREKMN